VAVDSQLAPAIQFAKRLKKYLRSVLASAIDRTSSSILKGVNNKIKVIKRMAHGFRDSGQDFPECESAVTLLRDQQKPVGSRMQADQ
jgi:hypothetical protein